MTTTTADPTILVEYTVTLHIAVDYNGDVSGVSWPDNDTPTPTGNLFALDPSTGRPVTAGVPEPPPKFGSIEEAEEWMEANAGRVRGFDVEITAERAAQAQAAAAATTITDWL